MMPTPLFGRGLRGNFYNYCPCLRHDGKTLHVYYCTNRVSGNITDHIGYRKATLQADGWHFSREKIVLAPSAGTWDARHTCDPSVVRGTFRDGPITYHYLMAYLGCVTDDCKDNETGIAFAERPEGPWIKYAGNPLIPFIGSRDDRGRHRDWGYGQPCVVSADRQGQVMIFYNVGIAETFTRVEQWDLADIRHPQKLREARLRDDGYFNRSGEPDVIANADFLYDGRTHAFYGASDMRGRLPDQPTYISDALPLLRAELAEDEAFPMATLFGGSYRWERLAIIDQAVSGFPKNHNPGLLGDMYGWVEDPEAVWVGYTVSDLGRTHPRRQGIWSSLHTYRIYGHLVPVKGPR